MAERALRGTNIGSKSLETEDGVVFAQRKHVTYLCPNGHEFEKIFALEAQPPAVWGCKCGEEAELQNDSGVNEDDEDKLIKPLRTHWDMLVERRKNEMDELEALLQEQLKALREGRLNDGIY